MTITLGYKQFKILSHICLMDPCRYVHAQIPCAMKRFSFVKDLYAYCKDLYNADWQSGKFLLYGHYMSGVRLLLRHVLYA